MTASDPARTTSSDRAGRQQRRLRWRQLTAEFVGTAFLLAAVVGSGIVTQQDGPASAQLLQHAVTVGAALTALFLTFGPVSGAHFNPVVTLADAWFGGMPWSRAGRRRSGRRHIARDRPGRVALRPGSAGRGRRRRPTDRPDRSCR